MSDRVARRMLRKHFDPIVKRVARAAVASGAGEEAERELEGIIAESRGALAGKGISEALIESMADTVRADFRAAVAQLKGAQ